MTRTQSLVGVFGAAALVATASAGPLVGVAAYDPFNSAALYSIDTATGAATLIGDTGVAEFNGLAFERATGTLYGYTTDAELYTINTTTGAATLVANGFGIVPEGGIAIDATGAILSTNGGEIGTVDRLTGNYSTIGSLGLAASADVSGLTSGNGVVYAYEMFQDQLLSIDTTTGAASVIGDSLLATNENTAGLAWDFVSGGLFFSDGFDLFSLDAATGAGTRLGSHGVVGFSGLAFIPAPGAASLFGLAGLVAARRRR